MNEPAIYELLLSQQKQIRELSLHLEALKRMFFEHRPPFVQAFAQQLGAVESSGFLRETDESIRRLERQMQDSRKS
jgi:predicted DNA-binding transcriptional regulator